MFVDDELILLSGVANSPSPGDALSPASNACAPSSELPAPIPDQPALALTDEQQRVDTSTIIYTLLEEARLRGRRIRRRIKYSVITLGLMLHLLGWLGTLRSELFRGIHPRCFISTLLISLAVMLLSVLPNERRTIGFTAALALVLQITGVCSSSISIQRVFASIRGARARRDGGAPADLDVSREYVPVQDIWVRELIVSIYCICVVVFGVSALYVLRSLLKHRCTRYTLESVWSAMGVVFITYASYSLVEAIVLPFYVSDRPPQIDALQTFAIVATLVTGVGMLSVRARARLMGWVAARCESSSVAVHMAMLMGGGSADVMRNATSRLRAVSAELLKPTDLAGDLVARDVFLRSRPAHIGEIDAFISHSWRANPQKKWEVLSRWCEHFRAENGRMPLLWIDRLCIDPDDPAMAVGCLPVFVSACNSLVILFEPTLLTRLWCLVEIFAFLTMHQDMGSRVKIIVLDITVPPPPTTAAPTLTPGRTSRQLRSSADGESSRGSEVSRVEASWQRRFRTSRLRQSGRVRPVELEPGAGAPVSIPVTNIAQVLRPMTIESFDVRQAVCTYDADTVYLQDLIDAYPGGIIVFNRKVRDLLALVDQDSGCLGLPRGHRIADRLTRSSAVEQAAAVQGLDAADKEDHLHVDLSPPPTAGERAAVQ